MKEKNTHAGEKDMQSQARAVSNGTIGPATSEEIERRRRKAARKKQRIREVRIQTKTEENRRKSRPYSLKQTASLAVCFVCFFALAITIVMSESNLKSTITEVNALQTQYDALAAANDTLQSRIASGINIDEIYRIATEELGMAYPKKSQVIVYKRSERGLVKQNEDIPEK